MKTYERIARSALLLALLGLFAPAARAGSVAGRVLDASGKPIAGAKVQWTAYRNEDELLLDQSKGTDAAVLGETATDAEGRFRVALEKPGTSAALRVMPAGLPSARFEGPFDASEDISLADVQMIGAQPVSGRVVDESGKPLSGVRVTGVATQAIFDNESRFLSETRTGADGSFAMADAPEGARVVLARAPGFIWVTRLQLEARPEERIVLHRGGSIRGTLVDTAGKPAAGAIVAAEETAAQTDAEGNFLLTGVAAGLHRLQTVWKEDFAARRDNVRVKDGQETPAPMKLARACAIAGTVVEEGSRKPVAGVRVAVYASGGGGGGLARRRAERAGRTDARGRFRVGGLAGRPYTVEASKDGYLSASIAGIPAASPNPGAASLALRRAASIAGRVTDEKGQAVTGARVRIAREMGVRRMLRGMGGNPAQFLANQGILTGPDGTFRLRGLTPERNLAVEATKPGYATASRPGVSLKAGDAIKDIALVLRRGLEARGRIVDAKGDPIAGAEIRSAHREEGMGGVRVQMRLAGMDREKPDAVSGGDGSFVLRGLDEGQYTLVVTRDGFARKSVPSLEVKATEENVWPPIAMISGVAIAGAVRGSGGQPVSGAQIFAIDISNPGRPQDSSSDPEGKFRLEGFTPERPILLNVTAPGYAPTQKNVTPPADEVAVVLKSAGTVRGRVEDADTKRAVTDFSVGRRGGGGGGGGMQIALGGRGGDQSFQSEDGTFELADVPPGKWTLRASAAGYRGADIAGVEVGEGDTKEGVVFSLKRGGGLSGRVVDPRGSAVANAAVSWHSADSQGGAMGAAMARMMGGGGGGGSTTSDADGRFSFDGLSEGRVTVTASHPDYLDASRDVDPAKEPSVDLALGTGASIAGTVVGSDGRSGVSGALVSMNEEGDAGAGFGVETTRTDGSGNFLFEHLKAGRFKLTATASAGKSQPKDVVVGDGQRMDGVLMAIATGALLRGTVSGLPTNRLGGVRIFGSAKDYNDSAVTDDSGNFTLRDAPAGAVRIQATTSFLSGKTTGKTVEVPEGAAEVPVQIVFEGTSRLAGRVTRGDRPVSGLFVNAVPDPPRASGGRASGQTDEDGRYALEGLEDGNFQVNLSGQGISYRRVFAVSGDSAGDIALPPVSITGTVTEAGSGDPLEGVVVQAQTGRETQAFSMKQGVTDSNGHYFLDDVDSGSYQLSARKGGYQAKTQAVTVGAESTESNFALQRGEGLTIHANDGLTGLPLKGLTALAYGAGGTVAYSGTVNLDSTGRGEITSLGAGVYSLYLFSDGYSPRNFPALQIPSPALAVVLTPGGRVEVRPQAQVTGRILDSAGAIYLLSPFRLDGRVSPSPPLVVWDNFTPGSYRLVVSGAGGEKSYPFTVVEGQTTTVAVK